ncbi:MAG: hypothetical protein DPW14_04555 [Planctomycetes bacterium]|nr:hypothetical protein [Planctomycetota bacterium]
MKIPIYGKAEAGAPLRRIVKRAAGLTRMSEATVALVMSHFIEGIEIEVCYGNAVTIPGFGMFASVRWESRAYPGLVYPSPRFFVAKGFRNSVGLGTGPNVETERRVRNFIKGHCVVPRMTEGKAGRATTHQAMKKLRDDIAAQARRYGIDPLDLGS